jgi:Protein of unknown function (DUF3106)
MQVKTKLVKLGISSALIAALVAFASLVTAQNAATSATTASTSTSTSAPSSASSAIATQAAKPVLAVAKIAKAPADIWDKLTPAQQIALKPLAANWAGLSEGHKRKWLAVSANFAQFSPEDKTKLHSRMTDWASLSAKQREEARINFAQTKQLTATDKQAKWESYKALPPETKQALANINVAPKPTGAATAAKPDAKDKLVASTPKADKATVR